MNLPYSSDKTLHLYTNSYAYVNGHEKQELQLLNISCYCIVWYHLITLSQSTAMVDKQYYFHCNTVIVRKATFKF